MPSIAASDDGRVLIAWQSRREDGSGLGVFARLFDQDGTPSDAAFQVNQTIRLHQYQPAVDFTADGGFAVAWSGRGPGDRWGIFVREYNTDGSPEGNERIVNQTIKGLQIRPGLSRVTDGFVVTWTGRGNGDRRGMFASLFQETPVTTTVTLSSIADQTIPELQAFSTTASVTGTQSGVQFSLVGDVPDGAAIDATSGQLTWTPSEVQGPGTFDFTVRATLGTATDDETFRLTVTEVNQAPVLAAIGNRTVTAGSTLSFTATATDGDLPANTLRYSLGSGAPAGAAIDSNTGQFSWAVPASTTAGDVSVTVLVSDNGSQVLTDSETITVSVTAPPLPSLSISDVTSAEGDTGTTAFNFTVTLSAASQQPVTVDFASAAGTADTSDFQTTSGSLTFAAGETTKTISVTVNGDLVPESDETLTVVLSNAVNASLGDATGVGTIQNDDQPPTVSVADLTVNEAVGNAVVTVTLSEATGVAASVNVATSAGTATSGTDYTETTTTLTFAAGETQKTFSVPVLQDALDEPTETFTVVLSNPTGATIGDGTGVVSINDDDPAPLISIADASIAEGNSGQTSMQFTVTLDAASGQQVTVDFSTSAGTAAAGSDFVAQSGTLAFAAGVTQQTISIPIIGDTTAEPDETLSVLLTNAVNASLADSTAVGTITNDDAVPAVTISSVTVNEGSGTATLNLQLSAASAGTMSVDFMTSGVTAVSDVDFSETTGTVTFAPGETQQSIQIPVLQDLLDEADETFTVSLQNPVGMSIATGQATVTIIDDDDAPVISISDVSANEADSGTGFFNFVVSLSTASGRPVTVDFATANDTAVSGSDYTADSGTLSFAPGETTRTVSIAVLGDMVAEPDETFQVNLTNSVNAGISDATATGTILNDDTVPGFSIADVTASEADGNMLFTVTLSAPASQAVTVDFTTTANTATAGSDYTATSGTLSFGIGEMTQTVFVPISDDNDDEPDETFFVDLSNPSSASIVTARATGTIVDNDEPVVTLSVSDVSVTEGQSTAGPIEFQTSGVTVGTGPESVASANINGDGFRDVVVANRDAGTVSILLSNGDGTFQTPTTVSVGTRPVSVIAADLNGDGLDDVVTADSGSNALSILLNASGVLTQTSLSLTAAPLSIVAGDFVSTAAIDLAIALQGQGGQPATIVLLPGIGNGTFGTAIAAQGTFDPFLLLAADLNAAGKQELVSVNDTGGITILTNDGSDGFAAGQQLAVTDNPVSATIGFVNGDASPDIILVTSASSMIHTFLNDGSGTFGTPVRSTLTVGVVPDSRSVVTGDFNNDLFADLAIADAQQDVVRILTGDGSGAFSAASTFTVGAAPFGLLSEDLNSDGGLDIVTADFLGNSVTTLFTSRQQTNAEFVVTLSAVSQQTVTVQFATVASTATDVLPDNDYTAASGTLTFLPGETTKSVFIPIRDDLLQELLEQFFLELSNPLNAQILDSSGTASITDND